jgi:hypothetical protein
MPDPNRAFSEFGIEEQRLGLDLVARHVAYSERRRAQARALDEAEKRLSARSYFAEVHILPDLDEATVALIASAHERYFEVQEAIRQEAEAALSRLQVEWSMLAQELASNAEVVEAIRRYKMKFQAEPVIHEDMSPPELLPIGVYAFEDVVRKELEETRALLQELLPELLKSNEFRVAEEYVMDGGGLSIGHAADELRAARDMLAKLRSRVVSQRP